MGENEAQPMSDEMLAAVAPVLLSGGNYEGIAQKVLGLTLYQISAQGTSSQTESTSIYRCLRLAVERKRINTPAQLRAVLERASSNDVISRDAVIHLDSCDQKTGINMQQICVELARFVTQQNLQALLCGYFDITLQEIENQQSQPVDHRAVCVRILSLWRRLNSGCNSAKHLIQALERASQQEREAVGDEGNGDNSKGEDEERSHEPEKKKQKYINVYDEIIPSVKQQIQDVIKGSALPQDGNSSTSFNQVDLAPIELLRLRLKDRYTDSYHTLNPLPWVSTIPASILNDVFITLYVDEEEKKAKSRTHQSSHSSVISMNDLFIQQHRDNSGTARLILLHGEAGSGKTTLTAKIALDWSTGQTHINKLLDFTVVLIIKASLIEESDTLNTYIERECVPNITEHMNVEKELCYDKVLIVIDGYDERRSKKDFIQNLVSKKTIMLGSTIVLTSRYGATQDVRHDFHLHVGLRGLSRNDIKHFVTKYADEKTKQNFLEMYGTNHPFIDTLTNPLYLWMFVLLGDEYFKDIQTFTRTDFYKQSLDGISDKAKHKLCTSGDIDHAAIDASIDKLSAVAYQCMKNDTLQLTDGSTVDDTMAKLGLLNAAVSRSGIRDKRVYVFAHKTILEFLTAKHIVHTAPSLTKSSNSGHSVVDSLLTLPEVKDAKKRAASMVTLFVIGLLQTDRHVVTDIIQTLVPTVSGNFDHHDSHLLLSLLCELDDTHWIPGNVVDGRIHNELKLTSSCTPYCMRGVEKCGGIRTLKKVELNEYSTHPTSPIKAQSCHIQRCPKSLVASVMSVVDKIHIKEVWIWSVTLTSQQYSNVMKSVAECKELQWVGMWNIELSKKETGCIQPMSPITTQSFHIQDCSSRVVLLLISLVDKECIHELKIRGTMESITLTPQQYSGVMSSVAECRKLKKVEMGGVELDGNLTDSTHPTSAITTQSCYISNCASSVVISVMSLVDKHCIEEMEISGGQGTTLTLTPQKYSAVMNSIAECRVLKRIKMRGVKLDGDVIGLAHLKSPITIQSCRISGCSSSIAVSVMSLVDKDCVQSIKIDSGLCLGSTLALTSQQYNAVIGTIVECRGLRELEIERVELDGDVTGVDFPDTATMAPIDCLTIRDSPTFTARFIRFYWSKAKVINLEHIHLSHTDITSIKDIAHHATASQHGLKLKWLDSGDISRLLKALCAINCVNALCELEVWCRSDEDCEAVGEFVVRCEQMEKFSWRNSMVWEGGSDSSRFQISVSALSSMWEKITTKATQLKTVVVQEFTDMYNYNPGSRSDSVLLSVLRDLSHEQREAIRWTNIHVVHPNSEAPVSDEQCRDLYHLLPNVQQVGKVEDAEDGNEVITPVERD